MERGYTTVRGLKQKIGDLDKIILKIEVLVVKLILTNHMTPITLHLLLVLIVRRMDIGDGIA